MSAAPFASVAPPLPSQVASAALAAIAELCDPGSIQPLGCADGIATASALLDGVPAVVFATDPGLRGGSLGAAGCAEVVRGYERAIEIGLPVVGIWRSGGARLDEGVASLDGVGRIFAAMTRASGRVPQVSLVLGAAAGGAAYGPALTDVVVSGPGSRIFVTGPDVLRSVTGEDVDGDTLGGPVATAANGVAHIAARTDAAAMAHVRRVVGLLAGVRAERAPRLAVDPGTLLPAEPRRAYNIRPIIGALLDGPGEELQPRFGPNVTTVLGRLAGRPIGVVATNPIRLGGCLTAAAAEKAARFVRLCDAFGLPLLVLVDVPGYLPGIGQERDGVVRRGAKLLHAFAACSVPRVTVVLRKAYGGAYIAMNSRSLGATAVLAWPGAEVDVMGATAAVRILRRRELAAVPQERRAEAEAAFAAEHVRTTGGLSRALAEGSVDRVVEPAETRDVVASILAAAEVAAPGVRGRLTNIPL